MNRHVMYVPQTSLQGSCKLGDGANLLHGSDLSHHPELDHPKPSAKRTKPSRLPLGYLGGLNARRPHGPELGHLQIRRPLKLRSLAVIVSADHLYRVDASAAHPQAGAQKILAANDRSVTRALTAGKPVDRIHPNDMSTEVRFPHIGAGNFSCAVGKAGIPALAPNTPFRGAFPQSVEKGGDSLNMRKCGGRP